MFHLNIRGINANFNELAILINNIQRKPDVFVCTETWIVESLNTNRLDGYDAFYSEGKFKAADGVVVYIKEKIHKIVNIIHINILNGVRIELIDKNNYSCVNINLNLCNDDVIEYQSVMSK